MYLESETVADFSPDHSDDGTSVPLHDEIAGSKRSARMFSKVEKICSWLWKKVLVVRTCVCVCVCVWGGGGQCDRCIGTYLQI